MTATPQEIFNKVCQRATIKRKSVAPVSPGPDGERCAYRNPHEGVPGCFVGVLIDDEHYRPNMEGGGAGDPPVKCAVQASGNWPRFIDRDDSDTYAVLFLEDLQRIHDGRKPDKWESELRRMAKDWGLDFPEEMFK